MKAKLLLLAGMWVPALVLAWLLPANPVVFLVAGVVLGLMSYMVWHT